MYYKLTLLLVNVGLPKATEPNIMSKENNWTQF